VRFSRKQAGLEPLHVRGAGSQSGQSLVEVLVASALMGVGIVTGLTALAAAERVGTAATRQAWATCAVRAEAQALEAAPWSSTGSYPAPKDGVVLSVSSPQPGLQVVTVSAGDNRAVVYKAQSLSNSATAPQPAGGQAPFAAWCDQVPRSGP
jgi:Tfp pilus assembly protein PilV